MTEAEQKSALREKLRSELALLPEIYLAESDKAIQKALFVLPEWEQARRIFVYYSIGREISTQAIILTALRMGKHVALPQCGKKGWMQPVRIDALEQLVPGLYGIPEPAAGEILGPEDVDLALIPGLAFDRAGFRLGQGGGYYDRWLANFSGLSVGLCRQRLLQSHVPRESHDQSVALVITEQGALRR